MCNFYRCSTRIKAMEVTPVKLGEPPKPELELEVEQATERKEDVVETETSSAENDGVLADIEQAVADDSTAATESTAGDETAVLEKNAEEEAAPAAVSVAGPNSEDEYDPEVLVGDDNPVPNDDEDDDYDPEVTLPNEPKPLASSVPLVPGLPPKPPVVATSLTNSAPSYSKPTVALVPGDTNQLNEAYNAIMQSDLVKDPKFSTLPQAEQMKLIYEKLNSNNVQIQKPIANQQSNPESMNFDQVYSFNKPFKNLKNPIPLIPVNPHCRRPNITAPMSKEEEVAYEEFIQREAYYMKLQNWDEFPDKSRLFIGNLPANTISKQDLFRIFNQYGEVIQIAIKAGFGFAQFRTAEACLACIKGELDVPLHNKIMRLDASKPLKSRSTTRDSGRGRERSAEDEDQDSKRKKITADCQVYITGKSSVFFIRKVKKAFGSAQITIDTEDVTYKNIQDVISEAAYSGVLGTCVINELKVDVRTFETSPDGGIKFDEYSEIEPEVAADLLLKAKQKKYGANMPAYYPQNTNYNDNGYEQEERQSYGRGNDRRDYGGNQYGGNQYGNDRRDGGQYGNDRRGGRRDDNRYSGGRHDNYRPQNQGWDRQDQPPYGQGPPQYSQGPAYGNPGPSYNQPPQNSYGGHQGYDKYRNAPPQGYDRYQPPQNQAPGPPNQQQIAQQLQSLDPQSMQTMLNMLQQQQGQAPQPNLYGQAPPPPQPGYGGYSNGPQYGQLQPINPQAAQVNALLSQLQQKPSDHQHPQSSANTQALMDTLARLSRK